LPSATAIKARCTHATERAPKNGARSDAIVPDMRTASFFDYTGSGRISIARFPPRGTPAGFRVFRALAPGPWFKTVDEPEYRRRYDAQLAVLDPQVTFDALNELAGGAEPVLLCWERKADLLTGRAFCHRRIVADWFRGTLGATVDER